MSVPRMSSSPAILLPLLSLCLSFIFLTLLSSGVSGQAGDSFVPALLSRQPVLNLNFTTRPSVPTNWYWMNADPTDSLGNQTIHQGVALLNGTGSWIDVSATASSAQGAYGMSLPSPFGGPGFNGSGWSIEMVVKFPTVSQNLGSCLFLFQDAIGSWMTVTWGNTFDTGDVDSNNRLEAVVNNNAATGVPTAATSGHIEFFVPQPQTWYHMLWTVAPFPSLASGNAVWSLYINGVLLNYANALYPNSTLTPIQGANYPQASNRTIATVGKDSGSNYFLATLDAFRVYDYLLPAQTVASLASAYSMYNPTPTPTSYPFPASAEVQKVLQVVSTPPIFDATFSVNPTTDPNIPTTNYQWAAADPVDYPALQGVHSGVVLLTGGAGSYINLQQASGPQSCGLILPIFGLPGSGTPGLTGGEKIFDFGQGGTETWDWAYQGSQIQFESQVNVQSGLQSWASSGYQSNFLPSTGVFVQGVWYHVVATLSNPSFVNYSSTLTVYINGKQVSTVTPYSYPLPTYRPLSFLGGADYNNPNLPLTLDAFRIYDYALNSTTIQALASLYTPPCSVLSGTGGDFLVPSLLSRLPILNLNFTSSPSCVTGVQSTWLWNSADPTDNSANQAIHQGVAVLNGSPLSYIDVSATASVTQGAYGVTLPAPFGGPGFNGSGWSIEMVVKLNSASESANACLFLFQDAIGSWITINTGNTYDYGDPDTPNRLQATVSNNAATGVPSTGTGGSMEFFAPVVGTWYHIAWVITPYGSLTSGQALWQMYVNGVLLNYANALVPNTTFAPIQGAAYPQNSTRTIAIIGKDTGSDFFQMTLDAFRVYDYALGASTVASLASAYQMYNPTPAPTSYPFPPSAEVAAVTAQVPTPPIFDATFSVNPTTDPAIPYTNYKWAAADPSDSAAIAALHPGVVMMNGSALSYINLQQSSGPQSCGLILPIFGLPGSGTPGVNQGLTFEVVLKYPTGYSLSGGEKIFDFGMGGLDTWDWAYQGSQIQFETQNTIGPGILQNGVSNRVSDTFPSTGTLTTGVWQHVVMVLYNPSFVNYTAAYMIYINGSLVGSQNPSIFPLPIYRPLSFLAGADYNNPNLPLTLDAFRIYDYALSSTAVASLYNALYNPATARVSTATATLCFLTYALPGTIDYPFSIAISLNLTYNTLVLSAGGKTAYAIVSGNGTRVFTNRFGVPLSTVVTVLSGPNDNLVYTSTNTTAFDASGLTLSLASPVQLPGQGPLVSTSTVTLIGSAGGAVFEVGSYSVDTLGQVLFSNLPGFTNVAIGASNVNALAVVAGVCAAPLTFTNGLRAPTQPSASNGAVTFTYSYSITDGATYSVQSNLTITTTSQFASVKDLLGNPYQTVISITGTRIYTYLGNGQTLTSIVSTANATGQTASQRWYPYSLLSSAPGVYSVNSVPFIDGEGLLFTVSPAVPANGMPVTATPTSSTIRLFIQASNNQIPALTEQNYVTAPLPLSQQQTYII